MGKSGDLSYGVYTRILNDDFELVEHLASERNSTKSQILRHAIHLGLPLVSDEEKRSFKIAENIKKSE